MGWNDRFVLFDTEFEDDNCTEDLDDCFNHNEDTELCPHTSDELEYESPPKAA
jgi:hypothetical protein